MMPGAFAEMNGERVHGAGMTQVDSDLGAERDVTVLDPVIGLAVTGQDSHFARAELEIHAFHIVAGVGAGGRGKGDGCDQQRRQAGQ